MYNTKVKVYRYIINRVKVIITFNLSFKRFKLILNIKYLNYYKVFYKTVSGAQVLGPPSLGLTARRLRHRASRSLRPSSDLDSIRRSCSSHSYVHSPFPRTLDPGPSHPAAPAPLPALLEGAFTRRHQYWQFAYRSHQIRGPTFHFPPSQSVSTAQSRRSSSYRSKAYCWSPQEKEKRQKTWRNSIRFHENNLARLSLLFFGSVWSVSFPDF